MSSAECRIVRAMCREYEGNGRSVVGILRSDTRTCSTYLSLFGSLPMRPRVSGELAGSNAPGWAKWVAKHWPVTPDLLLDHRVGQVCSSAKRRAILPMAVYGQINTARCFLENYPNLEVHLQAVTFTFPLKGTRANIT